MKYRTPTVNDFDPSEEDLIKPDNQFSKTYTVKVITPIYGGGVKAGEPDTEMPIRASAIRGQLRYWWRFLYMNHPNNKQEREEDEEAFTKRLFVEERKIWGGMANAKELEEALKSGKDFSSKVFIKCGQTSTKIETDQYKNEQPQYALFPARENKREDIEAKYLIKEGFDFEMTITCKDVDFDSELKPALRWWMTFGGIGARTRRGLGSIDINDLEAISVEECPENCMLVIQNLDSDNALVAWKKAVDTLANFRQKPGVGRKIGQGNTPGRSLWPEPDSIREITGKHSTYKDYQCKDHHPNHDASISFPRAAFGLPIVFKFKDDSQGNNGCGEPQQTMLLPNKGDAERMASPLILTPYKQKGKYKPAALLLSTGHIDGMELKLKQGERNVEKPNYLSEEKEQEWEEKNWDQWSTNWWDSSKAVQVDPINDYKGENNATDALTAFMNFFAEGGEK